jgi:hypothetical protein
MAKSILKRLFNGEVYPSENMVINTPEYHKTITDLNNEKERLKKSLSTESREIFDRVESLNDDLTAIYNYEDFAYGFRLAVALLIDSQGNAESLFRENGE